MCGVPTACCNGTQSCDMQYCDKNLFCGESRPIEKETIKYIFVSLNAYKVHDGKLKSNFFQAVECVFCYSPYKSTT